MAAEQGFAPAQNRLGSMYEHGRGVTRDYVQAHAWYSLGASNGDHQGRKNRDEIAEEMTAAQLTEAQALAEEWAGKYNE